MNWLKGKKTYIIAGMMSSVSLIHLISGDVGLSEFVASEHINTLLEGVGLGTLRAGVSDKRGN
jgi:hypothetical protein